MPSTLPPSDPDHRRFFYIVTVSIALSFGALIASLVALEHTPTGFRFAFNFWTILSFVVAAIGSGAYWNILVAFRPVSGRSTATRRGNIRRLFLVLAPLIMIGFIGFLYPLKFVSSPEKKLEVAQGLGLAFAVLSAVGFLLWRVTRFIDPPAAPGSENDEGAKPFTNSGPEAGPGRGKGPGDPGVS